jgi:diguanylate cyclase (GGDEF)-like protein/PAS domain S-box-containing protein
LAVNDFLLLLGVGSVPVIALVLAQWRRKVRAGVAVSSETPIPRATPAEASASDARALVEGARQPAMLHNEHIVAVNPAFAALLGRDPSALVGQRLSDLASPEYGPLVELNLERLLTRDAAAARYEVDLLNAHGQTVRIELSGRHAEDGGRPAVLFNAIEMAVDPSGASAPPAARSTAPEVVTQASDVAARTTPERGPSPTLSPDPAWVLQSTASTPRVTHGQQDVHALATLDSLGEGVITTDPSGTIDFVNRAAAQLLGRPAALLEGLSFSEVVALRDENDQRPLADPVRQCLQSGARVSLGRRSIVLATADGSDRAVDLSATPRKTEDGLLDGVVVVVRDVTELRGMARQMSYQASHDALTGLVNRREFEHRLDEKLQLAYRGAQSHVLCYLDLDRFKAVNDTSGHLAGDAMLREVATLLAKVVRDSDTVARIGGDEFAILLGGCPLAKAVQIAENVSASIRDYRFVWKDRIFTIGVSIGLVELGRESGTIEDVMSAADSACYVAKSQGLGQVHVYSARDEAAARQRGEIQWLHRLQQALRDGQFLLYTQEIVSPGARAARGPALEVLVRLSGDNGTVIAPGDFLKAAERYRLMSLVDRWVVKMILSALGHGAIPLAPGRSVSINISGQTLGDAHFLEYVVDCFDREGVAPSQVCFEVTEASVVANLEHARRFIEVLHGLGCTFALDDFGNSLGSFANLKTLPMDFLKIDGLYMRHLDTDTVNQAMVAAMVELGRTLDFKIIAEQVEDRASFEAARRMGIDFIQGYVVARPQPLRAAA